MSCSVLDFSGFLICVPLFALRSFVVYVFSFLFCVQLSRCVPCLLCLSLLIWRSGLCLFSYVLPLFCWVVGGEWDGCDSVFVYVSV